jgi:hypothetical protein
MKVPIIVKCFNESTCPPLDKCIVCGVYGYDKYWNEEQTCKQEDEGGCDETHLFFKHVKSMKIK